VPRQHAVVVPRQGLSYMYDNSALPPHYTVRRNGWVGVPH
jgi:hypothetical protein